MAEDLPADSKIALFVAGSPAYFNDLPAADLLGKADPVIARTPAKSLVPGHNKWDFTYSLGTLRPDYVMMVSLGDGRPTDDKIAGYKRSGALSFQADLWTNEVFLRHCASNPVVGLDDLYQCKW